MHRSRLCHFVIDVPDLDQGVAFWSAALGATEEPLPEDSRPVYRRLRLPDSQIRILLQKTGDEKTSKERMHLDLEADDVEAEVCRLEALGATRWDHLDERGYDFWVLRDPWGNEFCVLQPEFPELLARQQPWDDGPAPAGCLPLLAVELGHVRAPCRNRVDQPLLAQGSNRAPGRGPRDLVRLDKLTLGRDAGVRRILARQDPALDDRRYLPVGRHRAERVDPLSWHMINFRYRRP